ncbi:MAG: hypothetical protein L3J03_09260 [Desulfobacterales bacterium]|nr:hypothetical protein [Desulfobacterales bacterium]
MISAMEQGRLPRPRHPFKRGRRPLLSVFPGSFFSAWFVFLLLACGQTAFFVFYQHLSWWLVAGAVLPGAVLAGALVALEAGLTRLKGRLERQWGMLLAGFVLFFLHLIGYLVLSSLLLASPMGWFFQHLDPRGTAAHAYGLFSANIFLFLGLASWLRKLSRG